MARAKRVGFRRRVIEWVVLLAGVAAAVSLRLYVLLPAYVPSRSMEPTLRVGDFLLIHRLAYRARLPQPGEIIAFNTLDRRQVWVKRVVAGPGDRVELRQGKLLRNGQVVDEPYMQQQLGLSYGPRVVPEGHVFTLGDNRDNSDDSRNWGPLRRDFVVGKVFLVYWPAGRVHRPR